MKSTQEVFPRCRHSVYDPERRGKAYACSFCNPSFDDSFLRPRRDVKAEADKFHIPTNGHVLNENDTLMANAHKSDFCPKCGSGIHTEDGKDWTCAECGHKWKGVHRARR
jgi:hypothetical protein